MIPLKEHVRLKTKCAVMDQTPIKTGGGAETTAPGNGAGPSAGVVRKKRVTQACDRCHTQHQPCDNGRPVCSSCEQAGAHSECTYLRVAKRRGPVKGTTDRSAERLLGALVLVHPRLVADVLDDVLAAPEGRAALALARDSKSAQQKSALLNAWNASALCRLVRDEGAFDDGAASRQPRSRPDERGEESGGSSRARKRRRVSERSGFTVAGSEEAASSSGDNVSASDDVSQQQRYRVPTAAEMEAAHAGEMASTVTDPGYNSARTGLQQGGEAFGFKTDVAPRSHQMLSDVGLSGMGSTELSNSLDGTSLDDAAADFMFRDSTW